MTGKFPGIWNDVVAAGYECLEENCLNDSEYAVAIYNEAIENAKYRLAQQQKSTIIEQPYEHDYCGETTTYAGISFEEREHRRELRVKNCGKLSPRLDPLSGEFAWKPYYCGVYRECPVCRKRRAEQTKTEIEKYLYDEGEVYIFLLTEEQSEAITKDLKKSEFRKLPHPNNFDMVFISGNSISRENIRANNGRRVDAVYIDQITDWETAVNTPKGRRISGTLGKFSGKDEKSSEPTGKVKVAEILTNAPTEIEVEAAKRAQRETKSLDPHDIESLQEAIEKRQDAFRRWISGMGYQCMLENERKISVEIKRIKWIGFDKNPGEIGQTT